MKINRNIILTSACVLGVGGLLQTQAVAVEANFTGASVMLAAPACGEAHLRVSGDSGETNRSFDSCADMTFSAVGDAGQQLPDGIYHYELTMTPEEMLQDEEALKTALEENDVAALEEVSNRMLSGDYAVARDGGMFRVSGGAASEYNESVWEAEAQAETDAAQAETEQINEDPMPDVD